MSNLSNISLNLPLGLHDKLKKYKELTGIDVSNYCRSAIVEKARQDHIF